MNRKKMEKCMTTTALVDSNTTLVQMLHTFTPKQQELLLYLALGMTEPEARAEIGITIHTQGTWKYRRPDLSTAMTLMKERSNDVAMRQEAQAIFLVPHGAKVIKDIATMATKDWDALENKSEYAAKLRCMDIVTNVLGLQGKAQEKAPVSWAVLIQNKIEQAQGDRVVEGEYVEVSTT